MKSINEIVENLRNNQINFSIDSPLKNYTSFKIGGPAKILAIVNNHNQLETAIRTAFKTNFDYIVLGNGSNVLISDSGYNGIIILNRSRQWQIIDEHFVPVRHQELISRYIPEKKFKDNKILGYSDKEEPAVLIQVDSGIGLHNLIHELFKSNITGLQWFAGIPGSIGGAVYMNVHGGHQYFSDLLVKAKLFDGQSFKIVNRDYFQFDYDRSILQKTKEIIFSVDLFLRKGNVLKAKQLADYWRQQKSIQPQRSAGCVFRNLSKDESKQFKLSSTSAGFIIDKILKLKGKRIGDAIISPNHAAFIENCGNATAKDVYTLVKLIQENSIKKIGLELKPEIEFIGDFGY
ncbi:MAG: UDP-N-acetylmuramate dehydrogenase [Fidelibacterota bacterium]